MSRFETSPAAPRRMLRLWLVQRCQIIWRALVKYDETDGEQRAASFAYYAFFAMFPLILLLITIGTSFLGNQDTRDDDRSSTTSRNTFRWNPPDAEVVINTIRGW